MAKTPHGPEDEKQDQDIIFEIESPAAEQDSEMPQEGRDEETSEQLDKERTYEAMKKFTDEDSDEITLKSILGGDFLKSRLMVKMVMFFIFVVALCIAYTSNRYSSQQETILIDSLRTKLQDVKYNVLTQSSELMNFTRQSNIEETLRHTPDSLLRNSVLPPYLIRPNENYPQAARRKVKEVLVDSATVASDSLQSTNDSTITN